MYMQQPGRITTVKQTSRFGIHIVKRTCRSVGRERNPLRIGVIGTGNMGGMLARAFACDPRAQVFVYSRTACKAQTVAQSSARITVTADSLDVIRCSEVIFVCTKAEDGKRWMQDFGSALSPSQVVATTISSLPLAEWERWTTARAAIVVPSIVQEQRTGVMLVAYGSRFDYAAQECFEELLQRVATPFVIGEDQIRVSSDLTSCGPAFLSRLLLQWAEAAAATGKLSVAEAEHLLGQTLLGVADLLRTGMTFSDIIHKVAVPGGVTEAGLSTLQRRGTDLFAALHRSTGSHVHRGLHPRTPTLQVTTPSVHKNG